MKNPIIFLISLVALIPCVTETVALSNENQSEMIPWQTLGGNFQRTGLSRNSGPETGCIKWKLETDGAIVASVTIGAAGRVHIPCEDGKLYTLDSNGALMWSYDANSPLLSAPTIGPDGTVYVGSRSGRLFAVDPNGNLQWTYDTGALIFSSPAVSGDGHVYICSQDGRLYALAQDGGELWKFAVKGPGEVLFGSIFASPAIGTDGTIYIGGIYDPNLYALEPNNGNIKWTCHFESQGWPFASPVVAPDGTIYQSLLYDSSLYAINPNDGTITWSVDLADPNSGFFDSNYVRDYPDADGWSEPVLGPDGTIYVSLDDPYLRAVAPNGTIKWVTPLGTLGGFTLAVSNNGLIYAACDDGFLYVVAPDGRQVAQYQSDHWLSYPVIAPDNTIIVADSKDNSLLLEYTKNAVIAISEDCSLEQTPDLSRAIDLNSDNTINYADIALLAANWLNNIDSGAR
jgi:outer membrane protein assembly factor BamB